MASLTQPSQPGQQAPPATAQPAVPELPRDSMSGAGGREQWHDSGVGSDDEEHTTADEMIEKERLYRPQDVEAQIPALPVQPTRTVETEYEVSARTKLLYLGVYFFFNLALTIYNKAVLGKVS